MGKRRNLFAGNGGGGNGGGGNLFAPGNGGGGGARRQPKKKKDSGGGGGIGGLLKETVGIVKSAPSGLGHMAVDFGKEAALTPVKLGKKIISGPGSEESNDVSLKAVKDITGLGTAEAVGRGLVLGGEVPDGSHPLTSGFAQSMHRTGERTAQTADAVSGAVAAAATGHPGGAVKRLGEIPYVKAYNEGRLVGTVVEDVGNASMVASAVAKGLSAASGGALQEASAARATASALSKEIPRLESEVAAADAAVAATQSQALEAVAARGPNAAPTAYTQMSSQEARATAVRSSLEATKAQAAEATARADALLAGKSKALVQAHHMAEVAERMGAKGANAPFAPFQVGGKALGKVAKEIVDRIPGLDERLAPYTQINAVRRLTAFDRKKLGTIIDEQTAEMESLIHRMSASIERTHRLLGGDPEVWHAALVDLTGANQLLLDGVNGLTAAGARAEAIERLSHMPSYDSTPRSLEMALDIAEFRRLMEQRDALVNAGNDTGWVDQRLAALADKGVTPELMRAVDQVQAELRANVLAPLQERHLAGVGRSVALTPEGKERVAERATSDQPDPVGREQLVARQGEEMAAAREGVVDAGKKVQAAEARIDLDPEALKNLAATVGRDADLAATRAGEMLAQAATDAAMLDDILAATGHEPGTLVADYVVPAHTLGDGTEVPAEAHLLDGSTMELDGTEPLVATGDLVNELAAKVHEAGGRVALGRRHPVLGRAVQDLGLSGVRAHTGARPEALRRLERYQELRTKAQVEQAAADRLAGKADRLRQSNETLVRRVVRAVDRVFKAREKAVTAAQKAEQVRETIAREAGTTGTGEMPDWMLTREQYADRARQAAPDAQPSLDGQDWTHAQVVAEAAEAGQPVPPWVFDDYNMLPQPKRPENSVVPKRTHWDHFTGEPVTQDARNYVARKAEVDRINAERAANPYRARLKAARQRAAQAWAKTGAGAEYKALVEQVGEARKAVVAQARAELVSDAAFAALPDQVPFVPGRLSEYYDGVQQSLGAPDWSIVDEMERLRGTPRHAGSTDEDLFAAAYSAAYEKMPRVARENLSKLEPQEVAALYASWKAGRIGPDALGLDTMVDEWARSTGRGTTAGEREATYRAFSDAIERRARLRRIEASKAGGGFLPEDLVEFFRTTTDDEMRLLGDDAVMQTMLGRGSKQAAARAIFEGRLRLAAERLDAMIPRPDRLTGALEGRPFDPFTPDEVHSLMAHLQGVEAADDFMGAWYDAGQPSLDDAIAMLEQGEVPDWLIPAKREGQRAVAAADRRAVAAQRLDDANVAFLNDEGAPQAGRERLTPQERVLQDQLRAERRLRGPQIDLERTVARGGAQTVADLAEAQQARATTAAGRVPGEDPAALRQQAAARLAQPIANQMQRHGAQVNEYLRAVREFRTAQKRVEKWLPERFDREIARYDADIRNAPVRYRRPLIVANAARDVYGEWIKELEDARKVGANMDESVVNALRQAQLETVKTLRDITRPGALGFGPDGQPIMMPPLIEPEYVPGGRVGPGTSKGGGEVRLAKSASERRARGGAVAPTPEDFRQVLTQRVRVEIRNETGKAIEAHFGMRAGQVLGPDRMRELADEWKGNKRAGNQALLDEMDAAGYVPWNPRKSQPSSPNLKGYGTFTVGADDLASGIGTNGELATETLWIPKPIAEHFEAHFKAPGTWEMRARKFYDKPTSVWKTSVLAFSPRWHVNNIVGNFIMATAGAGISPVAWAGAMRDAYALLKRDELAFRSEHGIAAETGIGRAVDRLRGGPEARLARADARIARLPVDSVESIMGPEGIHLDPRIPQRGAGSAALDPYEEAIKNRPAVIRQAHDLAQRSYHFNGFMDDLNRVAVYLEKHRTMTPRDLAEFAAQHPALKALGADSAKIRKEAAVRMSLDALGNFRKMSPVERQVIRRAVPFYAWMKHITTLAVRLPLTNPVRVAWMLHLADLYGEPPEFDILANTFAANLDLPLIGQTNYIRAPRANPFEDVIVAPTSGSLGGIAKSAASSVGPIPRLAGAAFGFDTRTVGMMNRPPGTAERDSYGRDSLTPLLTRPKELLSFAANMTPLGQIGQSAIDTAKYGHPVLRYPTGQPYKSSTGATIPSGRSLLSDVAGLSGLPAPVYYDVNAIRQAKAERDAAAARAAAKRRRKPASSGARGSNLFAP